MLQVSQLFTYPIKSMGGVSLNSAEVTDRGFKYDRRWMLVDEHNTFVSQRTFPQLALLQVSIVDEGLLVTHKKTKETISIPLTTNGGEQKVTVWSDVCKSIEVSEEVSRALSDMLGLKCKLVYMPDSTRRRVDSRYAFNKEIASFADAYPFMMIGQSSLDDINNRTGKTFNINRFRPNIVFTCGTPFLEDEMAHFIINNINFYGVKLCARCIITTTDQDEAVIGKEPLKTLSTYRKFRNKIYVGQNLVHSGEGQIHVGDMIEIKERKQGRLSTSH